MQSEQKPHFPLSGKCLTAVLFGFLGPVFCGLLIGIGASKASAPAGPPYMYVLTRSSYDYTGAQVRFTYRAVTVLPDKVDDYAKRQSGPGLVIAICPPLEVEPGVYAMSSKEDSCRTIPANP